MAYDPQLAAALSGATVQQLRHWRSARSGPLLAPEIPASPRVFYSFRDVLALRTCVRLGSQSALPGIRAAIGSLRSLGDLDHLASCALAADARRNMQLVTGPESILRLRRSPGRYQVVAVLGEVMQPFPVGSVIVPGLLHPRPLIDVHPGMQGGFPVVVGTRVPYDAVASLMRDDGVPADEVRVYYPSVSAGAARDALGFAHYVDSCAAVRQSAQ